MKTNKKSINKKRFIILGIIVALIIVLSIIVGILEENKNKEKNTNTTIATIGYESIEQILNQYGCKLIKETKSKISVYSKDIYVEFKYNTLEGNEIKKIYYENIISQIAGFLDKSYRLIDTKKELVIEVQRKVTNTGIVNYIYAINGNQNYFQEQESKITLKNYKEDNLTKLEINSNIINTLIQNDWNPNIDFGTKDSTFDKYDIYFDEGIEVRKISGKVYNVVFTNKYQEEIVNGIKVGTSFDEIIQKLGEPTFGSKDEQLIGYKNNDIYVFFLKEEISIYRNEKVDTKEFEELLSKYINKLIDIKEFMNELTYLWPDYEEYTYNTRYVYINYPSKGIEIQMTSDNPAGIRIYKNYNITENIKKILDKGKITSRLEEDLIEKIIRYKINKEDEYTYLLYMNDGEDVELENALTINSELFYVYTDFEGDYINKVLFTTKTDKYPNRELNEKISQGFFAKDNIYIYSIENKGIYSFDVITANKNVIITGEEKFELKEYNNGLLYYDEEQINLNLE